MAESPGVGSYEAEPQAQSSNIDLRPLANPDTRLNDAASNIVDIDVAQFSDCSIDFSMMSRPSSTIWSLAVSGTRMRSTLL